jgi:hypothetical protein
MAAVTVTVGNVGLGSETVALQLGQAGEAITQGQTIYRSSSDNKLYKADANDTAPKAAVVGIAITPASTNGYFLFAESGLVNVGGTLAVGTLYAVGQTAGSIVPVADLQTNDYVTYIGTATTTALLNVAIHVSGAQKA